MSEPVTPDELDAVAARLVRLDRSAGTGWTRSVIRLVERYPGISTSALARRAQRDRDALASDLRRLADIGVTERSGIGHRLTPLGEAVAATFDG
jgi:hypothetical protein